ncbi:MAG: hypothetical protein QOF53_663 [Nocardioidaceae bacterium]|nr:hypothetical protein [Nocardioidaceae bacterium]
MADALAEAAGREARDDPMLPGTGGPAGNAVLTAWTGLVLLALGVAELLTLFDVRGLISWHVAIGGLLIPPALLKTGSTGWRMVRYYLGHRPYREAGPPVLLLRLLGPLVVASTVALLGTGVLLILLGEQRSRVELFSLVLFRIDWITLHQVAFAVWAGATGVHLLTRIVPALRLTFAAPASRRVPGGRFRSSALAIVGALAVALALVLVRADGSWARDVLRGGHEGRPPAAGTGRFTP